MGLSSATQDHEVHFHLPKLQTRRTPDKAAGASQSRAKKTGAKKTSAKKTGSSRRKAS